MDMEEIDLGAGISQIMQQGEKRKFAWHGKIVQETKVCSAAVTRLCNLGVTPAQSSLCTASFWAWSSPHSSFYGLLLFHQICSNTTSSRRTSLTASFKTAPIPHPQSLPNF